MIFASDVEQSKQQYIYYDKLYKGKNSGKESCLRGH